MSFPSQSTYCSFAQSHQVTSLGKLNNWLSVHQTFVISHKIWIIASKNHIYEEVTNWLYTSSLECFRKTDKKIFDQLTIVVCHVWPWMGLAWVSKSGVSLHNHIMAELYFEKIDRNLCQGFTAEPQSRHTNAFVK